MRFNSMAAVAVASAVASAVIVLVFAMIRKLSYSCDNKAKTMNFTIKAYKLLTCVESSLFYEEYLSPLFANFR